MGTPITVGLAVAEHAEKRDQLEFLLQVMWTDLGQFAVDMACWCQTNHATHDVDALTLVVNDETSLPEAFWAAATRLTSWLAEPHDADYWRAKEGLPSRWTCRPTNAGQAKAHLLEHIHVNTDNQPRLLVGQTLVHTNDHRVDSDTPAVSEIIIT
ncbi:hypothetical protein GCM10010095_81200 [Streptomyces anthocyanicus]|uniref:hypothetical protein n=1 Tax=Streptomyces TaxID=1883 RepID=UPI00087A3CEE|nr:MULTISPECIES: hypothetical protein [Streptomyces]REH24916.1 hypothetical protein BX268_6856 [Streptomyces sp. 2221.1]GGL84200.1 hypothetical protein GCM10010095_81200 [Streptomyces anthocyanicus]SDT79830.1 hypothetical protein SAMN05428941_6842 [Streptomyces sp. 2114.2]